MKIDYFTLMARGISPDLVMKVHTLTVNNNVPFNLPNEWLTNLNKYIYRPLYINIFIYYVYIYIHNLKVKYVIIIPLRPLEC